MSYHNDRYVKFEANLEFPNHIKTQHTQQSRLVGGREEVELSIRPTVDPYQRSHTDSPEGVIKINDQVPPP